MPKPTYNMELNKTRVMREFVHLGKYRPLLEPRVDLRVDEPRVDLRVDAREYRASTRKSTLGSSTRRARRQTTC